MANWWCIWKPRSERKLLVNDAIVADLRPQLSNFTGMRVYLQNPPTIRIGGQVTKSLYQFSHAVARQRGAIHRRQQTAARN